MLIEILYKHIFLINVSSEMFLELALIENWDFILHSNEYF